MARTPEGKGPIAIGLLVSVAAHAAALAVVTIDVPDLSPARLAVVPVQPAVPEPAETEPPIPVVEIRPPGMRVPSAAGGAASAASVESAAARTATAASAPSPAQIPDAPVRLTASSPSRVSLAPKAPLTRSPEIVLASTAGDGDASDSGEVDARPARGIILREGGSPAAGSGSTGSDGAGRSLLPGTGGVGTIGPGGDCITPGLVVPGGRSVAGGDGIRSAGRTGPGGSSGRRSPVRRSGIRP